MPPKGQKAPAPKGSTKDTPKRASMGRSPAALAKKNINENLNKWCPMTNLELDPACDPQNPKTVTYRDVAKLMPQILQRHVKTPLTRSTRCDLFGMELYYKTDICNQTGSGAERGALGALLSLTPGEMILGVVTASLGNFGVALAYYGKQFNTKPRIVFPVTVPPYFINKCKDYGAKVIVDGRNFTEARHAALVLASDLGATYISGYDHPGSIAGKGTIALEILEDLPETDAILVPIGGGAMIAGIAAAAKHINPKILIYGVEPDKCCCFYKAMEKDGIYETEPEVCVASMLGIPTAGCNAFHTAKSHISKMVLLDDDWITKAILHLAEDERMIVEGAGATSVAALFSFPPVLPELLNKTVVCIITGSSIEVPSLIRCIERAKFLEGRLIQVTIKVLVDDPGFQNHVFSMIANTECNVVKCNIEHSWLGGDDFRRCKMNLLIETRGLDHACHLKRVMTQLFPNICKFEEEPFSPIPICACYPRKRK